MERQDDRVLMVRIHDGQIKSNWGGRATSAALLDIFSEGRSGDALQVIPGSYVLRGFGTPVVGSRRTSPRGWRSSVPPPLPLKADAIAFDKPIDVAVRSLLLSHRALPIFSWLRNRINAVDHVIINGEGDFILKKRPTLWRCLLIAWLAKESGKKLSIINTILSAAEDGSVDQEVSDAVGLVFRVCDNIAFRDAESLRLAKQIYGERNMSFVPDALFSWKRLASVSHDDQLVGTAAEGLTWGARDILRRPFVALSGSSASMKGEDITRAKAKLSQLIRIFSARGMGVLVIPTCDGDRWMVEPARAGGAATVLPSIPLEVGWRLLAKAQAFISGRYHPTILAAMAGTPVVLMRSNSHKTSSLQAVLGLTPVEHDWLSDSSPLAPLVAHVDKVLLDRERHCAHLLRRTDELGAAAIHIRRIGSQSAQ